MRNIAIKAKPLGESYSYDESDIYDLTSGSNGLRLAVKFWNHSKKPSEEKLVEFLFEGYSRHRELDEIDLVVYWESKEFSGGFVLYEILSGGWLSYDAIGEQLLSYVTTIGLREWFICTSNCSATVLCKNAPTIKVPKDL
jgi:hypothetical protein